MDQPVGHYYINRPFWDRELQEEPLRIATIVRSLGNANGLIPDYGNPSDLEQLVSIAHYVDVLLSLNHLDDLFYKDILKITARGFKYDIARAL